MCRDGLFLTAFVAAPGLSAQSAADPLANLCRCPPSTSPQTPALAQSTPRRSLTAASTLRSASQPRRTAARRSLSSSSPNPTPHARSPSEVGAGFCRATAGERGRQDLSHPRRDTRPAGLSWCSCPYLRFPAITARFFRFEGDGGSLTRSRYPWRHRHLRAGVHAEARGFFLPMPA